MKYTLSLLGILAKLMWFLPAAEAQVATIESVQSFPLVIGSPFTTFTSSQPAILTLQVNEPAALTIAAPTPNGFSDPNGTSYSSFIRYNGNQTPHDIPMSINSTGSIDVEIGMQVIRPQIYPAGTYNYTVLLTITAQ